MLISKKNIRFLVFRLLRNNNLIIVPNTDNLGQIKDSQDGYSLQYIDQENCEHCFVISHKGIQYVGDAETSPMSEKALVRFIKNCKPYEKELPYDWFW